MLSINPPSGPPNGPATVLGPSHGTDDDSTLPEGFAALLAGLMVPPAPPAGTVAPPAPPAGTMRMPGLAPAPTVAPPAGEGADDAAVPGAADQPLQNGQAASDPRLELPGVAPDTALATAPAKGASVAGVAGPPPARDAGHSDPGLTMSPGVAASAVPAPSRDAPPLRATVGPAVVRPQARPGDAPTGLVPIPAGPVDDHLAAAALTASREPPPLATAMVERAAPASSAATTSVELMAGQPGASRSALRATVGPAVARPQARTGDALAGLMRSPAGPVDDYRAADDSLAWRDLLAVGGPAAADMPLDAAGSAEAPLAASAVRQLALAIGRAVNGDVRQLSVQLSPEELGGLEITIDFADERRVAVTIRAERPETLDLLRGETRQLERLMAQQGVSLAAGGFELGLMADGHGQRRERAGTGQGQRSAIDPRGRDDAAPTDISAQPPARLGFLNLSV